ncbi:MAG: anaerobic sulfatase-maturation protein [Acidobacteriota bacterium]|nr:anaerobic sulfatase-maturation protein [Acidobacteriota bacterium]
MGNSNFHVMAKPIGPICNLDCKYCFYLEKEVLYPQASKWAMRDEVLESYIRQYIEAHASPSVHFAWQGGEPTLLGVEYFQKIAALQAKYSNGKRIENAFQTNGVLLNDDWARFLKEAGFLVGISIDGLRELHDAYRVDKGGQPTFDRVMRGMDALKRNGTEFNTLTTVNRANAKFPQEVYRFLKANGSGYMQFIPIVERISSQATADGLVLVSPEFHGAARVAPWSVEPDQFGQFLCTIFDDWVRHDVGKCFVQLFDVCLEIWSGLDASLCVFRRTCGAALAIEHSGDLYSCDHFVYPENRLGNIMDSPLESLVESEQQRRFGRDKESTLPKYCRECDVRFACNGECPKHRFLTTPDGEPGLNYLCAAYKKFFHHIDPCMRFMAAELVSARPPANVMKWISAQGGGVTHKARRNDPCACGSGRKFKHCCGASA